MNPEQAAKEAATILLSVEDRDRATNLVEQLIQQAIDAVVPWVCVCGASVVGEECLACGNSADRGNLEIAYAQLQAIVDKVPKTADGALMYPGLMVWHSFAGSTGGPLEKEVMGVSTDGVHLRGVAHSRGPYGPPTDCYSTRELAEAAAKAAKENNDD